MQTKTKIKRTLKNIQNTISGSYIYRSYYRPIDPKLIVFSCWQGKELSGSILRTLQAVQAKFGSSLTYYLYTAPEQENMIRCIAAKNKITDVRFIHFDSPEGIRTMEIAAYLFTDSPLPAGFVKRPEQTMVYLYPFTPLLKAGKDSSVSRRKMDNLQRNLFMSDYLLFQNQHSIEHIVSAFSMSGLYRGKILLGESPADEILFDPSVPDRIRKELDLSGQHMYLYMPALTNSYIKTSSRAYRNRLLKMLNRLDRKMNDDEILFIHKKFASKIIRNAADSADPNVLPFRHIRMLPENTDLYEILASVDVTITDHSNLLLILPAQEKNRTLLPRYRN